MNPLAATAPPVTVALELRASEIVLAWRIGHTLHCNNYSHSGVIAAPAVLASTVRQQGLRGQRTQLLLQGGEYQLQLLPRPNVPSAEYNDALRWQVAQWHDSDADGLEVHSFASPLSMGSPAPELQVCLARRSLLMDLARSLEAAGLWLTHIGLPELALMPLLPPEGDQLLLHFGSHQLHALLARNGQYCMGRRIALPQPVLLPQADSLLLGGLHYPRAAVQQVSAALDTLLQFFASRSPDAAPHSSLYHCTPAQLPLVQELLKPLPNPRPLGTLGLAPGAVFSPGMDALALLAALGAKEQPPAATSPEPQGQRQAL